MMIFLRLASWLGRTGSVRTADESAPSEGSSSSSVSRSRRRSDDDVGVHELERRSKARAARSMRCCTSCARRASHWRRQRRLAWRRRGLKREEKGDKKARTVVEEARKKTTKMHEKEQQIHNTAENREKSAQTGHNNDAEKSETGIDTIHKQKRDKKIKESVSKERTPQKPVKRTLRVPRGHSTPPSPPPSPRHRFHPSWILSALPC